MKRQIPKRPANPQALAIESILPAVGEAMGLAQKVQEWSVLALWPKVCGDAFQGQSQAVKLTRKGQAVTLWVRTTHPTVAAALQFEGPAILQRLNTFSPQTGMIITDLRLS